MLFNSLIQHGYVCSEFLKGTIVPLVKDYSGNIYTASNYRGVTLISAVGKLFTSILNTRLNDWAETYGILCEIQFGFRRERGTADCMFILHGLIEHLFL